MLNPRDEVCKSDGWAAVGYLDCGKRFPIGTYSSWRVARLAAESWQKSMPSTGRYEIEQLYVPLTTEEPCDA